MVTDCDRGMPFVMAHPDSEATRAFKEIADICKEYVGFKEMERKIEMEESPYHFQKQEVKK
jgi:MinD-like ATPase involved in chromosome partitioning or flagellar assembly